MIIKPTGTSFYLDAIANIKEDDKVELVHKPVKTEDREYPNAVAIMHEGKQIGSLSELSGEQAQALKKLKHAKVYGRIISVLEPSSTDEWTKTYKLDVDLGEYIKSFTEDVYVDFDEKDHVYRYKGKELFGATSWLEKIYKPFPKAYMAEQVAKKIGATPSQVVEVWNDNGKVARGLGTVIHGAIENYYNHLELNRKTGKDGLPKHPILNKIVGELLEVAPHENVLSEVLVTDIANKTCGTIDRLEILGEKVCRIGDYKVNVGADGKDSRPLPPFSNLPAKKLTKYQLQMSYYARMLVKAGWVVEGLDAYVYEDSWKKYSFDVLDIEKSL